MKMILWDILHVIKGSKDTEPNLSSDIIVRFVMIEDFQLRWSLAKIAQMSSGRNIYRFKAV